MHSIDVKQQNPRDTAPLTSQELKLGGEGRFNAGCILEECNCCCIL